MKATLDRAPALITPAAVRIVDLDTPLTDLAPWSERRGAPYRSLLAIARLDGDPLGAVAVALDGDGRVAGERLAGVIRGELEPELRDVLERRGVALPDTLPSEGIACKSRRRRRRAGRRSVSVVVATCRAPPALERCLRSVLACDYSDFEVIVVESCPRSEATVRLLDEQFADEPRLRYVDEARPGLARARNAGLAAATGDVVMFTDDDVVVDPGWIGRCAAALDRDGVDCVTGLILPSEVENDAQLRFERGTGLGRGFRRQVFCLPKRPATHPLFFYRPEAIGACANTAVLADVARELGGFDATLGTGTPALGAEDLDLYVRLLGAGRTVGYDPSVVVWHERRNGTPRVHRDQVRRGTALGAAVTKQLVAGPQRAQLLRALPTGVRYELDGAARVGVALGPAAYAASALGAVCEPRQRWRTWRAGLRLRSPGERVLVAAGAASCLLAPALVAAGAPGPLRLAAVLALLCLAPGTALLVALGARTRVEPGLAMGASLGVGVVLAQSMLWLGAWWPQAMLYVVAAAGLPVLVAALRAQAPQADETAATWLTEVELGDRLLDLEGPPGPGGAEGRRARVLVRLHRQPLGYVEVALRDGRLLARDVQAAVDERLSAALTAHLARDGLTRAALGSDGAAGAASPRCAAAGFYGDAEPFVSVVVCAEGCDRASLDRSLRSLLAVDYASFEIVVARAAEGARPALVHPQLRYVDEPSRDISVARRRAVAEACGDVVAFAEGDVVVDRAWLRALVGGMTPASRVGCVTGTGAGFAASREALHSVDAFDGADTDAAPIERFLDAGWAVSRAPAAIAWRQRRRHGAEARRRAQRWLVRADPAAAHAAVLAAAALAWGISLLNADLDRMGGLGLLDALPPTYFAAFALLLGGFTAAVSRRALPIALLWLYMVALVVVLHGTTPLLYDEPRYTWTYTHLGVIALIAQAGAVDRSIDIYNNWPGFFALVAWFSSAGGLGAASFAAWAQVFFNLANVLALQFALRGVTRDERIIWTASLLFLLGNWVGQDYLAPQAFAFVVALVVLGLCLRCGRKPVSPAPLAPRAALLVGAVCYLAIVVSHQLTPVILVIAVTGLALIRRVPLRIPIAMAAVEAWWLWLAWPYVSERFSLLDPAPAGSREPAGYDIGDGLPGLELVAYAVRVELAILVLLAALGLVLRRRAGRWDLAAAILVVAPLLIVGVQSYGGEGRYRAYLFALPWIAFFAAAALMGRARRAVATAALGACLLFAYFGLELMNRVGPDDVAAARWFDRHGPHDSLRVGMTTNFPSRPTARYAVVYDTAYSGARSLLDHPQFRRRMLGVADLPRIERTLRAYGSPHTFVTLGASQANHARLYGLLPDGAMQSLDRALRTSPSFRLVYRRGSSAVFEYLAPRTGSGAAR